MTSLPVRYWRSFGVCPTISRNANSSLAVFGWNNRRSGVRFCPFQKNSEMCRVWVCILTLKYAVCGAMVEWIKRPHTRHTSEFFGNLQNRRFLFTPDLRLFKQNAAWDEGISANSRAQHRTTANIWLAVTPLNALFLRRIAESSQPSIIL